MRPLSLRAVFWTFFLVLSALYLLDTCVLPFTKSAQAHRSQILSILEHAKSIELVHYNPYIAHRGGDLIYSSKELDPAEISKIEAAFPFAVDYGIPGGIKQCMFDAHHKIVVTDRDGTITVIRVCLICGQMQVGEGENIFDMPSAWRNALQQFFADEGMPFSPQRYRDDYDDYREKRFGK